MSRWLRLALPFFLAPTIVASTPVAAAAQTSEAAKVATEWLGPRAAAGAPDLDLRRPIYQGRGAMIVEQQEAQRVIRSWWPPIGDARAAAIIDGFAWYLAAQAVEREFDLRYFRTAHSVESRAYLGDHIVWSFPTLLLSRHAAVRWDRYAATFAGLERWLGMPALQGAMSQVAQLPGDRLSAETIVRTISDAAGQDLSWAFEAAAGDVNYAVTGLSSTEAEGGIDSTVIVARQGSGMFTGRSAPRVGEFESGDAIRLTVLFADGTASSAQWDGRDQSRTFRFRGPSRATAAYLDPDYFVTLDRNRLDNAIVAALPSDVPLGKWAARWLVWLQHTMLSYGMLA